jgi:hypothetical protein
MMNPRYFLLGVLLLLAPIPKTHAQDQVDFAGTWSGNWKNSLGEAGSLTMTLSEDGSGHFTGQWDDVKVTGRRTNANTLELRGKKPTRSYHYTATIKNGMMHITYITTRLDSEGSYTGQSTLKRE